MTCGPGLWEGLDCGESVWIGLGMTWGMGRGSAASIGGASGGTCCSGRGGGGGVPSMRARSCSIASSSSGAEVVAPAMARRKSLVAWTIRSIGGGYFGNR